MALCYRLSGYVTPGDIHYIYVIYSVVAVLGVRRQIPRSRLRPTQMTKTIRDQAQDEDKTHTCTLIIRSS